MGIKDKRNSAVLTAAQAVLKKPSILLILEIQSLLKGNTKGRTMKWFKEKKVCAYCHTNKTKREFENQPTCAECKTKILVEREPIRICPADGSELLKEHRNEIIIDRCPTCKGVWLDAGEIEAIQEAAQAEGLATGMVVF